MRRLRRDRTFEDQPCQCANQRDHGSQQGQQERQADRATRTQDMIGKQARSGGAGQREHPSHSRAAAHHCHEDQAAQGDRCCHQREMQGLGRDAMARHLCQRAFHVHVRVQPGHPREKRHERHQRDEAQYEDGCRRRKRAQAALQEQQDAGRQNHAPNRKFIGERRQPRDRARLPDQRRRRGHRDHAADERGG